MSDLEKLKKYIEWRDLGILIQSAVPDIDPTKFPDFTRSYVSVLGQEPVLEMVDFFDGGSFEGFVHLVAGDLFFYGNSFINVSPDLEQISSIGLNEVLDIIRSSGTVFNIATFKRRYPKALHLKIRAGTSGLGSSVLEPASEQIAGLFSVLDYVGPNGAPVEEVKAKHDFDEYAYKAIADVLGFQEKRERIYYAPQEFLNNFLSDIIGPLNGDFAVWLRNEYGLTKRPKVVKIVYVT